MLPRIAQQGDTVLITGESGTGKERVAQLLHRRSPVCDGPFVAVNCGAVPETVLESELFGDERGAFTGAVRQRRGLFEQAEAGTLFLDEIGDMPPVMQVKLLRAIEKRQIARVVGERSLPVSLRLVCATNRDLRALIEQGGFRKDLYDRINVIHLRVPPLRERSEDVLWLAGPGGDERMPQPACFARGVDFGRTRIVELLLRGADPGAVSVDIL